MGSSIWSGYIILDSFLVIEGVNVDLYVQRCLLFGPQHL